MLKMRFVALTCLLGLVLYSSTISSFLIGRKQSDNHISRVLVNKAMHFPDSFRRIKFNEIQNQDSSLTTLFVRRDANGNKQDSGKDSDVIEVDGIVKESLPNAKFRVELVATKANIVCSTSGKMRKNFVRVLVGDPVKVELSPYDLTRGRITFRTKGPDKRQNKK